MKGSKLTITALLLLGQAHFAFAEETTTVEANKAFSEIMTTAGNVSDQALDLSKQAAETRLGSDTTAASKKLVIKAQKLGELGYYQALLLDFQYAQIAQNELRKQGAVALTVGQVSVGAVVLSADTVLAYRISRRGISAPVTGVFKAIKSAFKRTKGAGAVVTFVPRSMINYSGRLLGAGALIATEAGIGYYTTEFGIAMVMDEATMTAEIAGIETKITELTSELSK
jgi:hypothetical protein